MPKRVLTTEEKKLVKYQKTFNKIDRINAAMRDDHITLRNQLDTNLGYYRENGPDDEKEIRDLTKLTFEEGYKLDLLEKYDAYQETFKKLDDTFKKLSLLQKERIDREDAIESRNKLKEIAEKNGFDLQLEEISLEVEGLDTTKKEFANLVNRIIKMTAKINTLANEKNYEKALEKYLKALEVKNLKKKQKKKKKQFKNIKILSKN